MSDGSNVEGAHESVRGTTGRTIEGASRLKHTAWVESFANSGVGQSTGGWLAVPTAVRTSAVGERQNIEGFTTGTFTGRCNNYAKLIANTAAYWEFVFHTICSTATNSQHRSSTKPGARDFGLMQRA